MTTTPEPVGVVLAGGASSRFGSDKAVQEIDGVTLTARAARRLDRVCRDVVIADRGRGLLPAREPVELLRDLAARDADIVQPRWSRGVEPLAALYAPAALTVLAERVARGQLSLHALSSLDRLRIETLEGDDLARHGRPEELFANLNTPQALAAYLTRERRS